MNIWLVTIGEPLPSYKESKKLRTGMLAERLVARGHSVLLFASAFDHFKKQWLYDKDTRIVQGKNYQLQVLKGTGYKKNISLKRFRDHRIIARKFSELAPHLPKPDIIISSLPPHDLAYHVARFARQNKIPVLVDIRDPWPGEGRCVETDLVSSACGAPDDPFGSHDLGGGSRICCHHRRTRRGLPYRSSRPQLPDPRPRAETSSSSRRLRAEG